MEAQDTVNTSSQENRGAAPGCGCVDCQVARIQRTAALALLDRDVSEIRRRLDHIETLARAS
jgi:hypothetical protein